MVFIVIVLKKVLIGVCNMVSVVIVVVKFLLFSVVFVFGCVLDKVVMRLCLVFFGGLVI